MNFYHSTMNRDSIIKCQKIKKRKFDYYKYLSFIVRCVNANEISEGNIPPKFPGSTVQAPYMGNGIYCFETYKAASRYQSSGSVVTIVCTNSFSLMDLDEPETLLELYLKINTVGTYFINKMDDPESKEKWQAIQQLLRNWLQNMNMNAPSVIVGILFFFLKEIMREELADVVKKKYSAIIAHEDAEPYLLIVNEKIITHFC